MSGRDWEFEIRARGSVEACGSGPDRDEMHREGFRYFINYARHDVVEFWMRQEGEEWERIMSVVPSPSNEAGS